MFDQKLTSFLFVAISRHTVPDDILFRQVQIIHMTTFF